MEKKLTRKQFLFSIFSFATLFAVSKVPDALKTAVSSTPKKGNSYGNYSYGGSKKNV
jgi:hypothetical protein